MVTDTPHKKHVRAVDWAAITVPAMTEIQTEHYFPRNVDKATMLERLETCQIVHDDMLSMAQKREQDAIAWFLKVDIGEHSEHSKMMREQATIFGNKIRDSAATIKRLTEEKFWITYQHSRDYWDRDTDCNVYNIVVDIIASVEQLIHEYDHKVRAVFSLHIDGYDRANRRRAGLPVPEDDALLCERCKEVAQ